MQPTPDVIAAAQAAARRWNVPASVTLAQWALESGWGAKTPEGSNNPFGIKARPGDPFVMAMTTEVVGGQVQHLEQPFRKFASLDEAFDYHAELLATAPTYRLVMAQAGRPEAFAQMLTGRYATDPAYGGKLIAIMRGSNLYQYDVPAAA